MKLDMFTFQESFIFDSCKNSSIINICYINLLSILSVRMFKVSVQTRLWKRGATPSAKIKLYKKMERRMSRLISMSELAKWKRLRNEYGREQKSHHQQGKLKEKMNAIRKMKRRMSTEMAKKMMKRKHLIRISELEKWTEEDIEMEKKKHLLIF